jgi:hypothetical protein
MRRVRSLDALAVVRAESPLVPEASGVKPDAKMDTTNDVATTQRSNEAVLRASSGDAQYVPSAAFHQCWVDLGLALHQQPRPPR